MGALQKVKFHGNERADLPDLENIENFVCADFEQLFKGFTNSTSLVVKGFRVFQDTLLSNPLPTASPVYVELAGSVLIHSSKTADPIWYVGATGTSPFAVDLTANATNYIEIDLTTATSAEDNRAFWDPTANEGEGEEFVQSVDTVINVEPTITVNTTGFVGGDKVPLAEIEVNSGGTIVALYDRRNMFFRLAKGYPYNGEHQATFTDGRYEAIHTVTLGSSAGSYLHNQTSANTTWTITHNLGKQYVSFTFYDENDQVIIPDSVTATSINILTATFSLASTGKCIVTIGTPSSQYYDHNEAAPATTWTIAHTLGTQYVNVRCYDSNDEFLIPDSIEATDSNTTTVTFAVAVEGNAFVTEGGGDGLFDVFNQAAPATTWTVTHNLNTDYADLTVYDSNDQVVIPDSITMIDQDTISIVFAVAESGNVAVSGGGGGTYIAGEIVEGDTSGTTGIVVSGGTSTITIHAKDGEFDIGERLLGEDSGSSRLISTIKESFNTSDKSIVTLKQMVDALMTEILRIKYGSSSTQKHWFGDAPISLNDVPTEITSASLKAHGLIQYSGGPMAVDSEGIASVTALSTGVVQINWLTAFANDTYSIVCTLDGEPGFINIAERTENYAVVETRNVSGTVTDIDFNTMVQGDQ